MSKQTQEFEAWLATGAKYVTAWEAWQHQAARIAQLEAQVKQLQRVPLSDDVRRKVFDDLYPHGALPRTFETFKIISRAIEAAHGITQEKQG